jgi:hypothetical protein
MKSDPFNTEYLMREYHSFDLSEFWEIVRRIKKEQEFLRALQNSVKVNVPMPW